MTSRELTERQRQAIECMEAARSAGMTLSGYVRAQGLNLRGVYDAIAQLRRRGIIPPPERGTAQQCARVPLRFARVQVQESAPVSVVAKPLRLRLVLASGRYAELEVEDLNQLVTMIVALERAA